MKKLLLISLVILGMLSLVSCKKTVQPSAFTPDSTPFSATLVGNVFYKYNYKLPADGAYTTVTAQLLDESSKPVPGWTFSIAPNAEGKYVLTVPMKKGAEKKQKYKVKATVKQPDLNKTFEGEQTIENVSTGETKNVTDIVCDKEVE